MIFLHHYPFNYTFYSFQLHAQLLSVFSTLDQQMILCTASSHQMLSLLPSRTCPCVSDLTPLSSLHQTSLLSNSIDQLTSEYVHQLYEQLTISIESQQLIYLMSSIRMIIYLGCFSQLHSHLPSLPNSSHFKD